MKFHAISVIWGDAYVDFFIKINLASLRAQGNFDAFSGHQVVYKIYTLKEYFDKLSHAFYGFPSNIKFDLIDAAHILGDHKIGQKFKIVAECDKHAIDMAAKEDAAMIFISPDMVFAKESFAKMIELVMSGKRAVMVAVLRTLRDVESILLDKFACDGTISIDSRSLVSLTLKYIHPMAEALFFDNYCKSLGPSQLYFRVSDQDIIARCFHLHPLVIYPENNQATFYDTLDYDYLIEACPNMDSVAIIDDSDDFLVVEPCDTDYCKKTIVESFDVEKIIEWASYRTNLQHLEFAKTCMFFHTTDIDSKFEEPGKYSQEVVEKISNGAKTLVMLSEAERHVRFSDYKTAVAILSEIIFDISKEKDKRRVFELINEIVQNADESVYIALQSFFEPFISQIDLLSCRDQYVLSSILKKLKLYDLAIKFFSKLVEENENNFEHESYIGASFFHLGEIVYVEGGRENALSLFSRALEYIPNHSKAKEYLCLINC